MIDTNHLKPFILSPNLWTREDTLDYFKKGWIYDHDLWPLVIQALEKYGFEENRLLLALCRRQHQTPHVSQILLNEFDKKQDINTMSLLGSAIASAPIGWLLGNYDLIKQSPHIYSDLIEIIDTTIRVSTVRPQELWKELQEYIEKLTDDADDTEIDYRYVDTIVDALAPYDVPDNDYICSTLVDFLKEDKPENDYMELVLINLAGARKLRAAIPTLVERFTVDADLMLDRCVDALSQIASPEVITRILKEFPSQSGCYQIYSAGVLANIKCEQAEQALLELLEEKNLDSDVRHGLCDALCDQFSIHAVNWCRRLIAEENKSFISNLHERIMTVSEVLGVEFPEKQRWQSLLLKDHEDRRQWQLDVESIRQKHNEQLSAMQRNLQQAQQLDDDDFNGDYEDDFKVAQLTSAKPAIPPNSPCPCNSGKKYKKCCGKIR